MIVSFEVNVNVQSRINISNDGFNHVLEENFSSTNKSQFTYNLTGRTSFYTFG